MFCWLPLNDAISHGWTGTCFGERPKAVQLGKDKPGSLAGQRPSVSQNDAQRGVLELGGLPMLQQSSSTSVLCAATSSITLRCAGVAVTGDAEIPKCVLWGKG